MAERRAAYAPEYQRQMVELVKQRVMGLSGL